MLWRRPDGADMTPADWQDPSRRVLGVLLDGGNIRERNERGEPVRGDTLLILLNALVEQGVARRFPNSIPDEHRRTLDAELALVGQLNYEPYFLTVADIVGDSLQLAREATREGDERRRRTARIRAYAPYGLAARAR